MRASLYLIGFAAASIVGAGAAEIGCSSSSGGSSSPEDSGTADTSTPPADTGSTEDAGGGDTSTPCVTIDASAATIVTGSPVWDCYESMCATALAECAADCTCNDAVLSALQCTATDAGSQTVCFAGLASAGASPGASMDTLNCLVGDASVPCQSATAPTGDGGTDAAPTGDAGDGG